MVHAFFVGFRDNADPGVREKLKGKFYEALKNPRHPYHRSVGQRIRNVYKKGKRLKRAAADGHGQDDDTDDEEEEEVMDVDGQGHQHDEDEDQTPPPPTPQLMVPV